MRTAGRIHRTQLLLLAASLGAGCASQPSSLARNAAPVDLNLAVERDGTGTTGVERYLPRGEIPLAEALRYSRMEELLAHRAPTLEVTSRGNGRFVLSLRGRPTLAGRAGPLIVIDGTPFGEAGAEVLAMLAPGDVRRVEVLRDASATSAYGSRGANGVLILTTRRGVR